MNTVNLSFQNQILVNQPNQEVSQSTIKSIQKLLSESKFADAAEKIKENSQTLTEKELAQLFLQSAKKQQASLEEASYLLGSIALCKNFGSMKYISQGFMTAAAQKAANIIEAMWNHDSIRSRLQAFPSDIAPLAKANQISKQPEIQNFLRQKQTDLMEELLKIKKPEISDSERKELLLALLHIPPEKADLMEEFLLKIEKPEISDSERKELFLALLHLPPKKTIA